MTFMFTVAEHMFTIAERIFRIGERMFSNGKHKIYWGLGYTICLEVNIFLKAARLRVNRLEEKRLKR